VRVVIPAAVCEHSLRPKELVGGRRESERGIGPQLPSTQDGKKGGKQATVALRLPGLGLVFMLRSERNNVHYVREQLIGERGRKRSEHSAGDRPCGVIWKRKSCDQKSERC